MKERKINTNTHVYVHTHTHTHTHTNHCLINVDSKGAMSCGHTNPSLPIVIAIAQVIQTIPHSAESKWQSCDLITPHNTRNM